jgi:hypothetical protein
VCFFHGDVTFDRVRKELETNSTRACRPRVVHFWSIKLENRFPCITCQYIPFITTTLAACCFCAPRVQFARVPGAVGTTGTHLRSDTLGLCAAIK